MSIKFFKIKFENSLVNRGEGGPLPPFEILLLVCTKSLNNLEQLSNLNPRFVIRSENLLATPNPL